MLATTKQLSLTLEHEAVGVVTTDLAGGLQHATDSVAKLIGGAELTTWWGTDGQIIKDHEQALSRALRGDPSTAVTRVKCVDGRSREIQSCVSPLRDPRGNIVGAAITLRDLTEPQTLGRELETHSTRLISAGRSPVRRT